MAVQWLTLITMVTYILSNYYMIIINDKISINAGFLFVYFIYLG